MNPDRIIVQLAGQMRSIASLVRGVTDEQARWKPELDSWSILEVVNHLYDEEREDFRRHLEDVLLHPGLSWHPIAPGAWVTERGYNQRVLADALDNFLHEREESLAWLKALPDVDWQVECTTPWGKIRTGDLLSAWAAHDLLHLRQLVELLYALAVNEAKPYEVGYAGDW